MPDNCNTCDHKNDPEEGWYCHQWVEYPGPCYYHTGTFGEQIIAAERKKAPATLKEKLAIAEAALKRIAKWHGEFPRSGRTCETGVEMSYGAAFGSNGERDYMRQLAHDACEQIRE